MIPKIFQEWFDTKGWHLRQHQLDMLRAYQTEKDILLLAPTGAGKTLAGFLPVLKDLYESPDFKGLHTIYISPLKALTNDIARNLQHPINEMGLPIKVESRTSDTSTYKKARQKHTPPHILLTTPESLALLLTYPEAKTLFKSLQTIIIDEIHSLASNKRGDQTTLILARLKILAPNARRIGLSATVADPQKMTTWLGYEKPAYLIHLKKDIKPLVKIIYSDISLPLTGHYPSSDLIKKIYETIKSNQMSIVFVNTRSQVERLFKDLWVINDSNVPIGIHHGSLTKDMRTKVETAITNQQLRAVVATSSLDLGVDWGNVDLVINLGAPKGISRLVQRIGRSNHRLDSPSHAILVPTNCFEALECQAALQAISAGILDDPPPNSKGGLDVLAQHIMSCACASPIDVDSLYAEVITAYPYSKLTKSLFQDTFNFVVNGGYVLEHYEQYHRLIKDDSGSFYPRNAQLKQRHRMNIGTIVEAEKLKVMLVYNKAGTKRKRGKGLHLGDIEERLILGMEPGDTFLFAGQILQYQGIRDLKVEVSRSNNREAKIPVFSGGRMPLSSYLAASVKHLLTTPKKHMVFPLYLQKWLRAQATFSQLPGEEELLVELFSHKGFNYITAYTFEGRPTNQTLGFLLSQRLENEGCHPLGFSVSDYGLSLWCLNSIPQSTLKKLWHPTFFKDELNNWLDHSSMLKRFFRNTAVVSGLTERKFPGQSKTGKQVTFSTDLIYEVLIKYDPNHLLLRSNRLDVERDLINLDRLKSFLETYQDKIHYQTCERLTPFSIPIILEKTVEGIEGAGTDALIALKTVQERSELLYREATHE